VVETDKFQFVLMFGGFLLLIFFLISEYGLPLDYFNKLPQNHKSLTGNLSLQSIIVWFLIASWTFIDPGFHQRTAAAKSPKTAQKAILISIAFWFVFDMLTLWTGIYATSVLQNTDPLMIYPGLAEKVLPPVIKSIFIIGLLATAMSTTDSFSFISAQTFGRDIIAVLNNKKSDPEVKHYTQIGLFITIMIALMMIWMMPSVVKMWYTLGSLFIPPMLIPILAGIYKKKINEKKIIRIMLVSFLFTCGWFFIGLFNNAEYPLQLEPFFPGLIVSIILYFSGSKVIQNAAR